MKRQLFDPERIIGEKYGRLTIICHDHTKIIRSSKNQKWKQKIPYVKCRCECGNICIIPYNSLRTGHTKSCGCMHHDAIVTHGKSSTSLYRVWQHMVLHCYREDDINYPEYGGRGIYICDEWYTPGVKGNPGFVAFYKWATENGYKTLKGVGNRNRISIDRIDNDGPYAPWNCRWVAVNVQQNNKRSNILFTDYDGETCTASQLAHKYGIQPMWVIHRVDANWNKNAILYAIHNPSIGLYKKPHDGSYRDKDGFIVMIPTIESVLNGGTIYNETNRNRNMAIS